MKPLLIVLLISLVDNINTLQYEDSNDLVDPFDMLNYDRATKTMTTKSSVRGEGEGEEGLVERPAPLGTSHLKIKMDSLPLAVPEIVFRGLGGGGRSHLDTYGRGQNQDSLNTCQTSLLHCESNLRALRNKSDETNETRQPSCPLDNQMKHTEHDVEVKVFMKRFVNMLIDAAGMKYVVLEQFTWKDFNIPIAISAEQLAILSDFGKSSDSVSLRALDEVLTNVLKSKDSGFAAKARKQGIAVSDAGKFSRYFVHRSERRWHSKDPGIHVSPHLVLAEMMSTFFLHPACALGNAVGTFSKGVLAIIVLIIVVLALISGCHINFCGLQVSNHRAPMLRGLQETLRQEPPLAVQPPTPGSSPVINISINLPGGGILSNSVEKIGSVISSSDSDTHIRNPSLESAEAELPTTATSDRDDDKSSVRERKSLATCNTKPTVETEDNVFGSELEIISLDNHSQKRKERDACFKSWGVSSDDIEELKPLDGTIKEQIGGQESGSDLANGDGLAVSYKNEVKSTKKHDNTNTSGGCGDSSFVMI
uniref:Chloride channel CLIC-like protein 1 n=1 Tax=Timema bartmani TaxID=61472 RepID=A0A7R9F551_9NEOP|nr:unnamed protein product [Timema bartmani]